MMTPTTLHARYVFPAVGEPIRDGVVTIDGGRIAAVGRRGDASSLQRGRASLRDLGNVAILPGLVNAHTHLEFSDIETPLGHPGISLPDWIRLAMARRKAEEIPTAIAAGLRESVRSGVTTLGDIVQPGQIAAASPIDVTAFLELIAPTVERIPAALERARSHVKPPLNGPVRPGLSPHAPYSVRLDLVDAVAQLSAAEKIPVAMHLAESPEELQWLRDGTGPFRTLLEELGAEEAAVGGLRPMDYLQRLAAAYRALVIHGNYLADDEIALLAANAERMAVVYCPRCRDWFAPRGTGCQPAPRHVYPLAKMLSAGVTVALGTDGRGSTPDLSILGEMRFAARRHPEVGRGDILRMGTVLGAKALGVEQEAGSLTPGKRADLAIVALPDRDASDPYALLFDSDEPVVACYCRGVEAFEARKMT
ncbi:MAG: amidohydrolase family protein [Thermoguttaceae bacterium]